MKNAGGQENSGALSLRRHDIAPVYDGNCTRLILGSFPSVLSSAAGFYYAHPQNRFWKVLAAVFGCPEPKSVEEKKSLLLSHGVALFDVIASCEITGSSDSAIRNVVPNDIVPLLRNSHITEIFVNGKTAEKYYNKYLRALTAIDCVYLPSTSPANAAYSLEKLINIWRKAVR